MAVNQNIALLLQKFADGSISKEEYNQLISHFKLSGNDEEIFAAMDAIWQSTGEGDITVKDDDIEQAYQKLTVKRANQSSGSKPRVISLWYRVAAAAILLIVLSAGTYWLVTSKQKAAMVAALNKIGPGGNKATLTLGNGKVIDLGGTGNGIVAQQQNVLITKNANGQLVYQIKAQPGTAADEFNTITTPRGGQYQVELPDGTKVWLNTASSLRFPVHFSGNERKVSLTGEAYFEVAKNKLLPFRVATANQQVEVLGTHFNINGYNDEAVVKTTLLEGAVKVTLTGDAAHALLLKPNEESVNENGSLIKHDADIEEAIAWKNGLFLFNGESLQQIMKQASRWYDVDVVFADDALKEQVFSGSISRFKNISQLIEVLESTGSVHFKIDGRRLTAMK